MNTADILAHLKSVADGPLDRATGAHPLFYRDAGIEALEQEKIWTKDWVCPGWAAELKEPGDYMTFTIGHEPVFTAMGADGQIKSFSNICRHRMMVLLQGSGNSKRVVCPYHAWT